MTDQITAQDRRLALRWCDMLGDSTLHKEAAATRRVILATVDAPAPTLAEELRGQAEWARRIGAPCNAEKIDSLAARAEQIEQENEEQREWNLAVNEQAGILARERDDASAEVERLTAERDTERPDGNDWLAGMKEATRYAINATHPNPADVPPGEAWVVEAHGERRFAAKDRTDYLAWNTVSADGLVVSEGNEDVTLIARIVLAPRVITNPDELDRLAEGTIVLDKDGDAWRRTCDEWTTTADYGRFTSWAVSRSGPVTVLWEPGE